MSHPGSGVLLQQPKPTKTSIGKHCWSPSQERKQRRGQCSPPATASPRWLSIAPGWPAFCLAQHCSSQFPDLRSQFAWHRGTGLGEDRLPSALGSLRASLVSPPALSSPKPGQAGDRPVSRPQGQPQDQAQLQNGARLVGGPGPWGAPGFPVPACGPQPLAAGFRRGCGRACTISSAPDARPGYLW